MAAMISIDEHARKKPALTPISYENRRPGSGRFRKEELDCFKRTPTPSKSIKLLGDTLASLSNQTSKDSPMLSLRSARSPSAGSASEEGGDSAKEVEHRKDKDKQRPLPLEEPTDTVLEHIFPKHKFEESGLCTLKRVGLEGNPLGASRRSRFTRSSTRTNEDIIAMIPRASAGDATVVSGQQFVGSPSALPSNASSGGAISSTSGVGGIGGDSKSRTSVAFGHGNTRLQKFRSKILEKFHTVKGAFELFAGECQGMNKELSRKQFSRFLGQHFPGLSREDHGQMFDFLDTDKSGSISMNEFHTAIEATAPVKTIEDLRRKWIALGFQSMRYAIQAMGWTGDKNTLPRLSFQDFGLALSRVGIDDFEEHKAIFNAIHDPSDRTGTVSLEQLMAALAAVSPPLILEEIRDRLLRKFGCLTEAYESINPEGSTGAMSRKSFCHYVEEHLKLTVSEAHKAFTLIDMDGSQAIDRVELVGALQLSEPNLFLEDVRRKVRQRFQSIETALRSAKESQFNEEYQLSPRQNQEGSEVVPPIDRTRRSPGGLSKRVVAEGIMKHERQESWAQPASDEFNDILSKVQFQESDTKLLLNLIDVDGDNQLSTVEIRKGIRLFAPSCALENLRLTLVRSYGSITGAFDQLTQARRDEVIDMKGFSAVLADLGAVDDVKPEDVFNIIESRRNGGTTIGELISALLSCGTGSQVRLTPEQRDVRAKQQIRWQLAPFRQCVWELRGELRVSSHFFKDADPTNTVTGGPKDHEDQVLQKCRSETIVYPSASRSYKKVEQMMRTTALNFKEGPNRVLERVHGYYENASTRLCHDMQLIGDPQHRITQHHQANKHRRFLAADAPLLSEG
eukprot:TRINITY_DN74474_c0_g1_i1.p1 TRINITY_DN74474_c0_g1~~TRINITY_DN74474_c0_g1_i1.p1  ORF type:complete len:951 (+),score=158.51 TRINITY_DN74474_c0_g1_i1:302-2854(+)